MQAKNASCAVNHRVFARSKGLILPYRNRASNVRAVGAGSVTESAGSPSPRMGRWNVATGGVRLRRTEPVVVLVYVTAPMGRRKRRLLLFKCLLGPSRAGMSIVFPPPRVSVVRPWRTRSTRGYSPRPLQGRRFCHALAGASPRTSRIRLSPGLSACGGVL